ncbi:MAG: HEAT repeat domain-containing protein, partial [Haloferula sp.]
PLAGRPVQQGATPTPVAAAAAAPAGRPPLGQPAAGGTTPPVGGMQLPQKKGMSGGAKIAIASLLGIFVIGLGIMLAQMMGGNKQTEIYNALVAEAAKPETTELAVDAQKLDILLNSTRAGSNKSRETVYKALSIAEATDGTDVDARIAEFATTELLPTDIRIHLLSRVLRKRANPAIKPYLLTFVRETEKDREAAAALTAVIEVGGEEEFDDFLDVIQFSPSAAVQRAAEKATAEIILKSDNKEQLGSTLATASKNVDDDNRRTMIRLLGYTGSSAAKDVITEALEGDDNLDKLAAIEALKHWSDESMFEMLMEFLEEQTDEQLRPKAFDAGYQFLMSDDRELDELDAEDFWKMLARNAKTDREQLTIIGGLAKAETSDWAIAVIEYFADEAESDEVIDRAERALSHIKERRRVKGEDD